jgi:hypothetical protein
MKTTLLMLIMFAMLCSCTRSNKAAYYQRQIKAYQDSAEYMGSEYFTMKADMYTDSLNALDSAQKKSDIQIKDTADNTVSR